MVFSWVNYGCQLQGYNSYRSEDIQRSWEREREKGARASIFLVVLAIVDILIYILNGTYTEYQKYLS